VRNLQVMIAFTVDGFVFGSVMYEFEGGFSK
jgi:hypothetical protein